jgi:hypothetical protein
VGPTPYASKHEFPAALARADAGGLEKIPNGGEGGAEPDRLRSWEVGMSTNAAPAQDEKGELDVISKLAPILTVTGLAAIVLAAARAPEGSSSTQAADPLTAGGVAAEAADRYWVGKVHRSRAYIAIARVESRALVYVCNGDGVRAATINEWFLGRARGTSLDLRSRRGATLTGRLTRRGIYTGELRLQGGRRLRFTAGLPRRKAAFFWVRHTERHADGELFDGFIQLPDGTDRAKKYGPVQ